MLLLALLCIGGVELLFCRIFAPEQYARIVGPVVRGFETAQEAVVSAANSVVSGVSRAWENFSGKLEDTYGDQFSRPGGVTVASQLVSDPALSGGLLHSDPDITSLRYANGRELLTGGGREIVYFNQTDPAWAFQPFGQDNIGGYGCGPVAMTMVVNAMTGQYITPKQMSQWAAENGYCARGSGSYHTIVQGTAEAYGLKGEALPERTVDCVLEALNRGDMIVALMGPGHFTNGGHFIVLRGATGSGEVLVADPSSRSRSLIPWDPQLILDELSESTDNGAPVWVISQ